MTTLRISVFSAAVEYARYELMANIPVERTSIGTRVRFNRSVKDEEVTSERIISPSEAG
jgi:hypothetical protein